MKVLLLLGLPMGAEWIVLGVLGLLFFGKKLPGVARSLGQSVVEFKKGIKGIKDEVEESATRRIEEDKVAKKTIDVPASPPVNASATAVNAAPASADAKTE